MKWSYNYIAITNNPEQAKIFVECGIRQIMVDTEILGKVERQGNRDTVISLHCLEDLIKIKGLNLDAEIICRINPYHPLIQQEIEMALLYGADKLMIPMINCINSYKKIVDIINSRAKVIPLIETPYSFFKVQEILDYSSIDQIHFGLNDLCISLGMNNLFEVLKSDTFQIVVKNIDSERIRLGIGGIGDPQVVQKVSPALLLNGYLKCGANSVILSRSFFATGIGRTYITKSLEIFEEIIGLGYNPTLDRELYRQVDEM